MASWLRQSHVLSVHFDDILIEFQEVMGTIFDHCELPHPQQFEMPPIPRWRFLHRLHKGLSILGLMSLPTSSAVRPRYYPNNRGQRFFDDPNCKAYFDQEANLTADLRQNSR